MAGLPRETIPRLTILDYSAIDGLGRPPYPVAVVGVVWLANWRGIDAGTYDAKLAMARALRPLDFNLTTSPARRRHRSRH
jgi:hypothetical protein